MNIVLIETSGNQGYIFATNKLRENVGASGGYEVRVVYRVRRRSAGIDCPAVYDFEETGEASQLCTVKGFVGPRVYEAA